MLTRFIDKVFRDRKGRVVIGQSPNWPMMLVFGFWAVKFVGDSREIAWLSLWGVRLGLLYWSGLEISSGVNLWRKFLGAVVLGSVLWSWLASGGVM